MTLGNLFPRAVLCAHQLSGQYSKGIDEVLGPQTSRKKRILSLSTLFIGQLASEKGQGQVMPPGQVAEAGAFLRRQSLLLVQLGSPETL